MQTLPEELDDPRLETIEDKLANNYGDFDALRTEWGREWQRAMQRRSMRRAKERAEAQKANSAIAHDDDAA